MTILQYSSWSMSLECFKERNCSSILKYCLVASYYSVASVTIFLSRALWAISVTLSESWIFLVNRSSTLLASPLALTQSILSTTNFLWRSVSTLILFWVDSTAYSFEKTGSKISWITALQLFSNSKWSIAVILHFLTILSVIILWRSDFMLDFWLRSFRGSTSSRSTSSLIVTYLTTGCSDFGSDSVFTTGCSDLASDSVYIFKFKLQF